MSYADALSRSIDDGAMVRLYNEGGEMRARAQVTERMPTGTVWMRDGWLGINRLTSSMRTVPDAAVLRTTENQPFVYVARGNNQFGQQLVEIGESRGGRTQILSGLEAGQHVVADGSLFLQFANSLQR